MAGNSFETPDGSHVSGAVAMAIGSDGKAVPIEADTPIGAVKVEFPLDQLCRALAAHAVLVRGGKPEDMEKQAETILEFATKKEAAQ